jgi:hydroxypyruvate isomerase
MRRRLFLQSAAITALAKAQSRPFRLSVRVEPLFPGLSLEKQIARVAEAGYHGFEFGNWREPDAAAITKLKNQLRLECVCIVGNRSVNPKGMGLCDPAERQGFLAEFGASLEAARRFETTRLVVLSGFKVPGMPREKQRASIIEGLKHAGEMSARAGVSIIVEVINTLAEIEPLNPHGDNHANYYLDRTTEAFDIMRAVQNPFVKVLFDFYHVQIMEGNLIETLRKNIGLIGHFHVADVPGRHEPGTGEINFRNVFRAIHESGFRDYVGMEYIPTTDAMRTLVDVKALAAI